MQKIRTFLKNALLLPILVGIATTITAQDLRVMTYNIRFDNPADSLNSWTHRREYLVAQVAHYAPDVLGTQEGLIHQLQAMEQGLEGYRLFGVGRDRGDREGEHTAIFYRGDRLELLGSGTFWLSETPDRPSRGWDAALNRICTFGQFRNRETGQAFYVFNTHFDHIGQQARLESVRLILQKISEFNREGYPAVLLGDLNLEPASPPIQELASDLEDAHTLAGAAAYGPRGTFNGFDCTQPATRRIDYVFLSPGDFEVKNHSILGETTGFGFPSDHFPVLADLRFIADQAD